MACRIFLIQNLEQIKLQHQTTAPTKETKLERAAFQAGWSELSWFGRTQPVLA